MTEPLESYATIVASRCLVASAAGIRKAIRGLAEEGNWTANPGPELVDDVMLELIDRGMVEVIESRVLC